MSYLPRVFISHSAKEKEAAVLCKAIAGHLKKQGFDVLWDKNLEPPKAWRAAIDEWIWKCNGAVLVMSPAATQSDYVAYEATLLRQRWKLTDEEFKLVPIWCPGVKAKKLKGKLGPIQLGEIQAVKIERWPAKAKNNVAAFKKWVAKVSKFLQPLIESVPPRHDIEDHLRKALNLGTLDREELVAIAAEYNLPDRPVGNKKDYALYLARQLLFSFLLPLVSKMACSRRIS